MKEYIKPKKEELKNFLMISVVLGFMFSFTYFRFADISTSYFDLLVRFTVFIFIVLITRLSFMKLVAYKNAIEVNQINTYFDKYWFDKHAKLSYYKTEVSKFGGINNFKGIPSTLISLFLYFLTLGLFIFPGVYNYKFKKIPHKHIGTIQLFENTHILFEQGSRYRESKVLFAGTIYFVIVAFIIKVFSIGLDFSYFNMFTFILYYLAIFNIIPIPGSEGFSLFDKNSFAWISAITILVITMIALLIFTSLTYFIVVSTLSIIIVMFVNIYKILMK